VDIGAAEDRDHFRMRSPLRGLLKSTLVHGQAAVWAARGARPRPGLRILYYHRVGPGNDQLTISPRRFARQLELIERTGYPVVDLAAVVDLRLAPDETAIVLNFDDGYGELLDHAFPALEARGWPATVFVVPGAVDGDTRFSWLRGEQKLLSWDQMRDVESRGFIRFEPHSLTHPYLPGLDVADAEREILGSKQALETALGRPARSFCYPGGYFGKREMDLVARAGYEIAVGCEDGVNRPPWDRFALRRVLVDHYDTRPLFAARLRGATDVPPPGRPPRRLVDGR